MTEEEINLFRKLTKSNLPDEVLSRAYDFKIKDGIIGFKVKMQVNPKDWKGRVGTYASTKE